LLSLLLLLSFLYRLRRLLVYLSVLFIPRSDATFQSCQPIATYYRSVWTNHANASVNGFLRNCPLSYARAHVGFSDYKLLVHAAIDNPFPLLLIPIFRRSEGGKGKETRLGYSPLRFFSGSGLKYLSISNLAAEAYAELDREISAGTPRSRAHPEPPFGPRNYLRNSGIQSFAALKSSSRRPRVVFFYFIFVPSNFA